MSWWNSKAQHHQVREESTRTEVPNERKHFQQIKREGRKTEQTFFQMKETQLNHCLDIRLIHYTYYYNLEWKYPSLLLTEGNVYVLYLDRVAWEAQERASFNCFCDIFSKEYNIILNTLSLTLVTDVISQVQLEEFWQREGSMMNVFWFKTTHQHKYFISLT